MPSTYAVGDFRARTTVIRPEDATLRAALWLAFGFAAVNVVLHLAINLWESHIGWGYFRDEFYYIDCARHMAWGYVDHGPGVAVQAWLALALFGKSLAGIRMLSALAGAARVFLTGMLAWALGGRRPAQGLAMIGVAIVPQYIALDGFLSMNSAESLFWMTCLLALILMVRGGSERLWILFGIAAGLGLLNKPSMTFFLVALLAGLLVTPQRKILFNRWAAAGVALLILIALPNLLWQVHHHWPTLEFLRNGKRVDKNVVLGPMQFVLAQILNLQPVTLLIWGTGLVWLLHNRLAKSWRWVGVTYLFFLVLMMALHAKDYYVTPVYPVLFAAGGVAWEQRFSQRAGVRRDRVFAFPLLEGVLVAVGIYFLPLAVPLMSPENWLRDTKAMHLYGLVGETERETTGPLPQFFADRFGWQEEVDQVSRIYRSLSPEDQKKVSILCSNYGEAGAINFLGRGLPVAASGQNNYFLWGPHGATGEVMILISGATPEELKKSYRSVEVEGHMGSAFSMPYEHRNIYLVRGRNKNLSEEWAEFKHYI
jgi:hypothetical protein